MSLKNTTSDGGITSPRKQRLNIILSQNDKERLDRLVEMIGADTVTEVTKDALRLLEFFVKKNEEGAQFYIQNCNEKTPTKLEFFGLSA